MRVRTRSTGVLLRMLYMDLRFRLLLLISVTSADL